MDEGAVQPRAGHRADIQGLRAIAIVAVVVCHSGAALPGGFVGVDVFFVISGFVIGQVLLRELAATGSVSPGGFYARRARRLLPSLTVALVAAVAVGIVVLNPVVGQPAAFRTSLYASVFVANAYLYRHLGYFDGDADTLNPFLHLWSLSVEEQFYVLLPVLVLVSWAVAGRLWPARRRAITIASVGVVSVGSFWASWAMTSGRSPVDIQAPGRFAFYSSPTRLWEMGVGVLLAAVAGRAARLPRWLLAGAGVVGALTVAGAIWWTDPLAPFPGLRAVPPVLGAGLLVLAGTGGADERGVTRALGAPVLRWIGDRSYTWYLWHWPFIVYATAIWRGSTVAPAVAALASLPVAAAAYALFEDRIRRDPTMVGRRAAVLGVGCVAVCVAASLLALAGQQRGWGVEEPDDWGRQSAGRGAGCLILNHDLANTWDEAACTSVPPGGGDAGTVLVLGDNHASSVSTAVVRAGARRGLRVAQWARSGCPFSDATPARYPQCERWQRDALDLVDRLDPVAVVIAARSTAYTTDPSAQRSANVDALARSDGSASSGEPEALDLWESGLRSMLQRLHDRGVAVVVVGGPPTYGPSFPVPSLLRPSTDPPVVARAEVDLVHDPVVAAEQRATASIPGVAYVDPLPLLCVDACSPVVDDRWRYLDGYDLNRLGADLLQPAIASALDDLGAER